LLLNHQDRIVSKDEIMTDLWNNDEYINENALTVNISRLRAKLSELGYDNIIETRKGIGYRII
jgi:DNA-binding response OmpR family regulator